MTEDQKDAQFKGPTKDGPAGDHRTSYPDSKGGQKRRIESDYGKTLQPAQGEKDAVDSDSDDETDKVRYTTIIHWLIRSRALLHFVL